MLNTELNSYLDNDDCHNLPLGNYWNRYGSKEIKASFREPEIKVPKNREGKFELTLVHKQQNIVYGLENFIISSYAKRMRVIDIEEKIREMMKLIEPPARSFTSHYLDGWNCFHRYGRKEAL